LRRNHSSLCALTYVSINKSALGVLHPLWCLRSSLFVPTFEQHCTVTTPRKSVPAQLGGKGTVTWVKIGVGPGCWLCCGKNVGDCNPGLQFSHSLKYLLMYFPHPSRRTPPSPFCAGGERTVCVSLASFPV